MKRSRSDRVPPSKALTHSMDQPPAAGNTVEQSAVEAKDHSAHHSGPDRKAIGVEADIKERNLKRLRRIEGQIRGLQRMVEEDRYCADTLTQISSVQEALRAVSRELVRNHLKHCATAAIRAGTEQAEGMYDELVDMMYKHVR